MSFVAWLIAGLVLGFMASHLRSESARGETFLLDVVLGIIGAFAGGWAFTQIGHVGLTGISFWSMAIAVIGAVIVLTLFHVLARFLAWGRKAVSGPARRPPG